MELEVKKIKLSEVKLNPDNPRTISNQDMDRLVKSIEEFPDMMKLREIVVDENLQCLGGNMRVLALRKAGAKEATAKVVTGLTPEQKREFVIKDNGQWGAWDFDLLANGWDDLPLVEWGIKMNTFPDDPNAEWKGMPEHLSDEIEGTAVTCLMKFESEQDRIDFEKALGIKLTHKGNTYSAWYPLKNFDQLGKGMSFTNES